MVLSTVTYDNIRTKNIRLIGSNDSVLTTKDSIVIPISLSDNQVLVGTTPKYLVGVDGINITNTVDSVVFSLGMSGGISTLFYVPNIIPIINNPYYTCMVQSTGDMLSRIFIENGYSYRLYLECITEDNASLIRITNEWLIRYQGTIDIKNIFDTKYTMNASIQNHSVSVIPDVDSVYIQCTNSSIWSCKISMMRTHI